MDPGGAISADGGIAGNSAAALQTEGAIGWTDEVKTNVKAGAVFEFKVRVGPVKVGGCIDLFSLNKTMGQKGTFWTQGFGLNVDLGPLGDYGFGGTRESHNGGFSFSDWKPYGDIGSFNVSGEGLRIEFGGAVLGGGQMSIDPISPAH